MRMLKALAVAIGLVGGIIFGSAIGFGGGVPIIPSTPQYSEPSQIVATLNAFINQLNGNPLGQGGYAVQPGNFVSLGGPPTICPSGASPVTCTGQYGKVNITGIATLATGAAVAVTINNAAVSAASICVVTSGPNSAPGGAGVVVSVVTPGAGNIAINLVNAGATTGGAFNQTLYYNCIG